MAGPMKRPLSKALRGLASLKAMPTLLKLSGPLPITRHHMPIPHTMLLRLLLLSSALLLSGCDIPGLGPDPRIAQKEADAKAIGGACRHALRGVEDCYTLNPKASKAAVFAGWKEMDQYMRENNIEGVRSALSPEGTERPDEPKAAPSGKEAKEGKDNGAKEKPRVPEIKPKLPSAAKS